MKRKAFDPYRYARAALMAAAVLTCATGCDKARRHADLRWTEPVTLASGETVQIERHVEMWHERALGGGFSSAPVYKISSIELVSGDDHFPVWDAPLVPVVLDKDPVTREWIVVAGSDGCSIWERNGLPRPPYWAFRLHKGEWYRDAIPVSFLDRRANLYVEFDVVDESDELEEQIKERKQSQVLSPKHARQYSTIDATFEMRTCNRQSSEPIGHNELDLKNFRSLK